MEGQTLELIGDLLPRSYISQASASLNQRRSLIKSLLSQRCMPEQGWDDASVEQLLNVGHEALHGSCLFMAYSITPLPSPSPSPSPSPNYPPRATYATTLPSTSLLSPPHPSPP